MGMEIRSEKIIGNIERVIRGKRDVVSRFVTGVIAGGHILFEDVPGTGKTTLVKSFARSCDIDFSRIQCTPDLLPSDITGISIYDQESRNFRYQKGPVFTNLLLADEINRTSPKTQSALLEVMEEKQVTENNVTHTLSPPFIVAATQNPLEHQGTYRLPEAQLDRFIMRLSIGYADTETENAILDDKLNAREFDILQPVVSRDELLSLMSDAKGVTVSPHIRSYAVSIVDATRSSRHLKLGASTRTLVSLVRCAQAAALIGGRNFCIPDDIKNHVHAVLGHRIFPSPLARSENMSAADIITYILDRTQVPGS